MEVFSGKTLLLADDDQYNIFAMSAALEDYGFNIIIAANGKDAIASLHAADTVDIVLMDIMMPVMDGYEAMQKIRTVARFQHLPIIALTAKAMKTDVDRCMEAGATDYMSKPVDVDQLIALIKKLIS